MKILIFGAGPLGSLLAARLFQGGHEVALLARGVRLDDLKKHGVALRRWPAEETESVRVPIVEIFSPEDDYDLVLVVMRKNSALKILPLLSRNKEVPTFLFLMNNAAGPGAFIDALGKDRVMMGFPGAAGYHDGHTIVHLNGTPGSPVGIVMGEMDGGISTRLEKIAQELEKGLYIEVTIEPYMDAWSKYHVALLFPSLAPALYLCGNDNLRMSRTRDALVLVWRGIKEGFGVLKRLGYPIRPKYLKRFLLMPEPLAVSFFRKMIKNPRMEVAMVRHAEVIRDEIQQLNTEFLDLVEQSGIFTPTIRFLIDQYNKKAQPLPDGSRSIHLRWSEILIPLLIICLIVLILLYIL
jgi:ketopantoate reductase